MNFVATDDGNWSRKGKPKKETEIENRKFLTNTEWELILCYAGAVIDNVDRTIQDHTRLAQISGVAKH